jgi:hypothetical protein
MREPPPKVVRGREGRDSKEFLPSLVSTERSSAASNVGLDECLYLFQRHIAHGNNSR